MPICFLTASEAGNIVDHSNAVTDISQSIYNYGFTIVFCAVAMVGMLIFFMSHTKKSNKRNDAELEMANQEKMRTMEQNSQMFNLVTEVQTEQVTQLREMTSFLREMNSTIHDNANILHKTEASFERLKSLLKDCDSSHTLILHSLNEVLDYVKKNETTNNEILEKVHMLEYELKKIKEE